VLAKNNLKVVKAIFVVERKELHNIGLQIRIARPFLLHTTFQNGKNIPNDHEIYQMVIKDTICFHWAQLYPWGNVHNLILKFKAGYETSYPGAKLGARN
jgi:hypothetical protein